jgi:ATP-binding cassette subfamily B protein
MPYDKFVKINSSTLTKTIITEAGQLSTLISSLLLMMSETLVAVSIYTLLIFIDFKITLLLTCFLIINAMLMLMLISRRIKKYGVDRESIQKKFYETINKSMGNFKIIKLQLNDKPVMDEFFYSSQKYAKINVIAQTLLQTPKFILEAIGFSLIIIIVLLMISKGENNISNILGTLSVYVLALYRLMPSVNKMLSSYNNILFSNRALDIIYKDFMNTGEILDNQSIVFNKDIIIKNIKFEFEKNKPILQNINFNIKKGSKVAFIGESGSGKSTLVDIIIGLYRPIYGSVEVDGVKLSESNIKHWRGKVGYIPQSIYLLDGTVGDNVAFNHEYNRNKIIKCLKQAKIYDFLNSKNGLSTMVGEGGVMLSGGQKQRIAIARALYTDPEILVLDEATSALDSNTEREIMDEIYSIGENRTMIIIAHRVATLDKCDVIYTIKNGNIVKN